MVIKSKARKNKNDSIAGNAGTNGANPLAVSMSASMPVLSPSAVQSVSAALSNSVEPGSVVSNSAIAIPIKPIGILGGTFDPIHLGHLHLVHTVIQQAQLQKVKLIPCYQSPHRSLPLAAAEHRTAMIRLALAGEKDVELDDIEVKQEHVSYTVDTVEKLRQNSGDAIPLCLIMGADAFTKFHLWRKWQRILQLVHVIVVTRGEYGFKAPPPIWANATLVFNPAMLAQKPAGYIWFTDIKPLDISATAVRDLIRAGGDAAALIPSAVCKYIAKHNLYRSSQ